MRSISRFGIAAAALGLAVSAGTVMAAVAQAGDLTPVVTDVDVRTSSTVGGGIITITGADLYDVVGVSFGDTVTEMFESHPGGTSVRVLVPPAEREGQVDLTVHLSGSAVVSTVVSTVSPVPATTSASTTTTTSFSTTANTDLSTVGDTGATGITGPTGPTASAGSALAAVIAAETSYTTISYTTANSYPAGLVDDQGLVSVPAGTFTYADNWSVLPAEGDLQGGDAVVIRGDALNAVIRNRVCLPPAGGQIEAQAVEDDSHPINVWFDEDLSPDAELIYEYDEETEQVGLVVRAVTPPHAAGTVGVSIGIPAPYCDQLSLVASAIEPVDACEYVGNRMSISAAAIQFRPCEYGLVVAAGFTYRAPARPTSSAVEETTTDVIYAPAPVTSGGNTAVIPTATTSSAAPTLSQTGVTATTLPMLAVGLGLLAAGGAALALGRRGGVRLH